MNYVQDLKSFLSQTKLKHFFGEWKKLTNGQTLYKLVIVLPDVYETYTSNRHIIIKSHDGTLHIDIDKKEVVFSYTTDGQPLLVVVEAKLVDWEAGYSKSDGKVVLDMHLIIRGGQ